MEDGDGIPRIVLLPPIDSFPHLSQPAPDSGKGSLGSSMGVQGAPIITENNSS